MAASLLAATSRRAARRRRHIIVPDTYERISAGPLTSFADLYLPVPPVYFALVTASRWGSAPKSLQLLFRPGDRPINRVALLNHSGDHRGYDRPTVDHRRHA